MSAPFDTAHCIERPARSALHQLDHRLMGFRYTLNLYRGCRHACPFCYARYTHWFLGYERPGDFHTQIEVKINAPPLLAAELRSRKYDGTVINMGAATDNYQPAEKKYRLVRRCLRILDAHEAPICILTKSDLPIRDIDLLRSMAARRKAWVAFTLTTVDESTWRFLEPNTLAPARRLAAMARLAEADIPVGLHLMPIVPFLTDREEAIRAVMHSARKHGASFCGVTTLVLAGGIVKRHYLRELRQWDREAFGRTLGLFMDDALPPAEYRRRILTLANRIRAEEELDGGYPELADVPRPGRLFHETSESSPAPSEPEVPLEAGMETEAAW